MALCHSGTTEIDGKEEIKASMTEIYNHASRIRGDNMCSIPLVETPNVHRKLFLAQTEHCIHVKVIATTTAEVVFKYPMKFISKFTDSQYGGNISELAVGDCYVFFVDQKGHYYPVYNTTRNEITDPSVYGRVKSRLCLYESPNVKVNLGQL